MRGRAKAECGAAGFLAGGGEMGALMRAFDWSRTPLGPVETWSQSLRMMVGFLLANRFPLLLWWGPQYISIYNDAYRPVLGEKHPKSMGQPASECWSEIWHVLQPLIDTPFNGGPATWSEDLFLELNRYGFVEETHFTIAYSPVPDETTPRGIGGVLATVHEITEKVIGERRVLALRDLGARAAEAKTAEDACTAAAATLADYAKDVPFALLYLIDADGRQARLAGAAGIARGEAASPLAIDLREEPLQAGWPLPEAVRSEQMVVIEDLQTRFRAVPQGPWSDPPRSAVVVPVRSTKAHQLAGLLVAGVSARLRLDDPYRGFFELIAGQIAITVANARAHEEERRRAEALAEIDRTKTAFFSNVSHEFRTPLTLMLGPLEDALALPAAALQQRRDDLELVHRNGLRLLRLVNTLLDFSRIEAGRVEASYEPVDLSAATADLASVFRAATDRAGLFLTVDCPPLGAPVWVDRDMWEKIVLNLLSNAFKFTFQGGIAMRLRRDGASVVLSVEDTGIGIPAHEIPRLFDRFHRVEGARGRTHEGTGIGLALVQELVRLHGGAVRVESAAGAGSIFTVTIPLGTAHLPPERLRAARTLAATGLGAQPFVEEALRWLPDADEPSDPGIERALLSEPQLPDPAAAAGGRGTVLVADDNADMRDYLRRLLGARYEVRAAADGEEALAALRAKPPDLLLSDIMMPRMDGYALLRAVRADPALAGLPVILLSARAGEEAKVDGLDGGADDYLVKPFSARELLARVGANLELARVRRNAEQSLRRASEETADILESIDDAFFAVDHDWRLTFINHHAEQFWGKRREEVLGQPFLELFPHAAGTPLYEAMSQAMRERRTVSCEALSVAAARGGWVRGAFYPYRTGISAYLRDITEQKHAEEMLRESEARLRLATEAAEVGFWDVDPVNDVLVWPPVVKAMFGIPPEAPVCMAEDFHARLHPDDRDRVSAAYAAACDPERRALYDVEYRTIGKEDGAVRWVAAKGRALFDAEGRCARVLGTAIDITQRKRTEALTECQRAALQKLAEGAPLDQVLGFLVRTAEYHIGNGMLGSILLLNRAGTHFERGIGPSLPPAFNAAVAGVAVGSALGICCHAVSRREPVFASDLDADPRWARFAEFAAPYGLRAGWSTPILGRDDRVLGTFANYYRQPCDPTPQGEEWVEIVTRTAAIAIERIQAERELRESRENLTAALTASDTGTSRWDPRTGEFLEFDENLKRLFGFSPDEPVRVSEDFIARVHPDDRPGVAKAMDACRQGADFAMEYRVVLPDGVIRWLYDRARMGRDDDGNPTYLVGACTDITSRKGAEAALRELNDALERKVEERTRALEAAVAERQRIEAALHQSQRLEAIGRLTGGVAHDFNNLLTVVMGQAEAIAIAAAGDPRIARMAVAATRAAERGAQLTSQLLSFSGRQQLRPAAIAVDRLILGIGDLLRRAVGEAITVEISADPELWPSYIDPVQFESAILNLAINARDAMPEGGYLVITMRNAAVAAAEGKRLDLGPGEYVIASVADSGAGMTPEVQRRAFEPFFTTKDVGKGTGLGLAQIYGFARQSGGTAMIDSAPGRGTKVALYLPRARAPAAAEAVAADREAKPSGAGKTILVVEDQPEVREVIETSLGELGYRVLTAPDGVAARGILAGEEAIDLLLTDVVMPNGVSGLDLAQEARRLRQDLKIVLVSGYLREARGQRPALPDLLFLEKPFRQSDLADTVAAALAGTRPVRREFAE